MDGWKDIYLSAFLTVEHEILLILFLVLVLVAANSQSVFQN